jgi:hypothetical protein
VFFGVAIIQFGMASVAFAMPISIAKPAVDSSHRVKSVATSGDGERENDDEKASLLDSNADENDD